MGQENIGSVTNWEPGADTDWAYEAAQSFLAAALGNPPDGVAIRVVWSDHELGTCPALAVTWPDFAPEPWDFMHRAEDALNVFNDAIDWSRLRPSDFWPENAPADEDE